MPDLDLSWPSPELAEASAAVLADLDLPSSVERHDQDEASPPPPDGDDR